MKSKALFRLLRPANIVTSVADVWAGAAVSYGLVGLFVDGERFAASLALLSASTACLYGGGVVLNDYFDAALDTLERPERPIPSGAISKNTAGLLGAALLLLGIIAACLAGMAPGGLAFAIAASVLSYNSQMKSHSWLGPLNMGLCRALNLLLGVSVVPELAWRMSWLGLFPLIFITAVTVISRGEVLGGDKKALRLSLVMYLLLAVGLLGLGIWRDSLPEALVFAACWFFMAVRPLRKAFHTLAPADVRASVKAGVLSLIILDATYAAVFAGWLPALAVALLLPVSIGLAKLYAVT